MSWKHPSPLAILVVAAAVVGLPLAAWWTLSAAPLGSTPGSPPFIVHEWGTFLSVQGSDGATLGGMVDSEEELPAFVRERSLDGRSRSRIFTKMETPVTFFYVDRPMKATVKVEMPQGLLTHWYPAVKSFSPALKKDKKDFPSPTLGSFLDWGEIELIPDRPELRGKLQEALKPAQGTWPFSRQTDAAFVKATRPGGVTAEEVEKFLFYRGLGSMDLPLHVLPTPGAEAHQSSQLQLVNNGEEALRHVFAIRVRGDQIGFAPLDDIAGKGAALVRAPQVDAKLDVGVPRVKQAVAASLVRAGLYAKEAEAMVNTWEHSYFRSEGLRVLYVLPRKLTNAAIPIQISPKPDVLERVMVGRVEVLSEDAERAAEKAAKAATSSDDETRQKARDYLYRLGRLEEPVLRRVLALSGDKAVKAYIEDRLQQLAAAMRD
jgi:hypothetical protein